jgi:outer membrane protein OmpA-like peptidoglycan-associated protein
MTKRSSSWRQAAAICSVVLLAACASQGQQKSEQAAAEAPAAAPVTPTQPSIFQIGFDSGKYDLSAQGKQTIDEVANLFQDAHASYIALVGHTDTVGSVAANTELARRRAMAVHDALMGTGKIPAGRMEAAWTGQDEQVIQTANGVPEARNRVVDIFVIYEAPQP